MKGMDWNRADNLVKEYEVASWDRCKVRETDEIQHLREALKQSPYNGQLWMELGLALAKDSYMREAADCYSMAITCDPFQWEYYRHRAHRFLSCWRFQDAAADFTIASRLNPDDWNVWYHLGLSFFLLKDYDQAEAAYKRCYEMSTDDKSLIAVTDWYWMTLKRLHKDEEAQAILDRITEGMDPEYNISYYNRLLLYKGLKNAEDVLDPNGTALDIVTAGFGVANYYRICGETEKADEMLHLVIRKGDETKNYFAFGYLAAMVDLTESHA